MPSTYTLNNGIELIGTGEQSGTWGDTTNTNLELLDTALDGQVTITATSAGSSSSPNDLPISDGSASNGRNRMVIITSATDLGTDVYYQLTPNDAEKIIYVRNDLNAQDLILFQGTYSASNDYVVPNGKTAIIFFDGAGTGAVAANVFNNAHFDAMNIVGDAVIGGSLDLSGALTVDGDTNGDPSLAHFYNISTGTAAEATAYITNSATKADGLFLQQLGSGFTTSDGFVQDGSVVGSGTGASGGLSIMTRAAADMRFYTNGHTNERLRLLSSGDIYFYDTSGNASFVYDESVGSTFNEQGESKDFRVKSLNSDGMFFVDGSADAVGFGTADPTSIGSNTRVQISGTAGSALSSTLLINAGYAVANRNHGIGFSIAGYEPSAFIQTTEASSSGAYLEFYTSASYTSPSPVMNIQLSAGTNLVNPDSADMDFRVLSQNNNHMFFVDAGGDQVNIGDSTLHNDVKYFKVGSGVTNLNGTDQFSMLITDGSTDGLNGGLHINSYQPRLVMSDASTNGDWYDWRVNGTALTLGRGDNTDLFTRASDGIINITPGTIAFNNLGEDIDFKIEGESAANGGTGNNPTYALYVRASDSRVGIGRDPSYFYGNTLNLAYDQSDSEGPELVFNNQYRDGSTTAGQLGLISFGGWRDINTQGSFVAAIEGQDATYPGTLGYLNFYTKSNGNTDPQDPVTNGTRNIQLRPDLMIVNDTGGDVDFQIKTNGNDNMVFVDGGSNHVSIGYATDGGGTLNVYGGGQVLTIESSAARGSGQNYIRFKDPSGNKGYLGYGSSSNDNFYIENTVGTNITFNAASGGEVLVYNTNLRVQNSNAKLSFSDAVSTTYIQANNLGELNFTASSTNIAMQMTNSGMIFNPSGTSAIDTRIRSDNASHMVFVDASEDTFGVYESAPTALWSSQLPTANGNGIREVQRWKNMEAAGYANISVGGTEGQKTMTLHIEVSSLASIVLEIITDGHYYNNGGSTYMKYSRLYLMRESNSERIKTVDVIRTLGSNTGAIGTPSASWNSTTGLWDVSYTVDSGFQNKCYVKSMGPATWRIYGATVS